MEKAEVLDKALNRICLSVAVRYTREDKSDNEFLVDLAKMIKDYYIKKTKLEMEKQVKTVEQTSS